MSMKIFRYTRWWLLLVLFSIGLAACGGSEDKPVAGYPEPGEAAEGEAEEVEPGQVVTVDPAPPSEEPAKGDEEGLEALGGGYEWRRVGGIAGFCDVVTVYAGTATVATCRTDPPEIVADLTLTNEQSRQVLTWLEELTSFEHEESDGAVADSMAITLTFEGQGDNEATAEIIAAMEALAAEVMRAASTR